MLLLPTLEDSYFLPTMLYGSRYSRMGPEVPPKSPARRYVEKRPRLAARSLLLSPPSHPVMHFVCVLVHSSTVLYSS